MPSYVMSVRKVSRGQFTADIGNTSYLVVPDGKDRYSMPTRSVDGEGKTVLIR